MKKKDLLKRKEEIEEKLPEIIELERKWVNFR